MQKKVQALFFSLRKEWKFLMQGGNCPGIFLFMNTLCISSPNRPSQNLLKELHEVYKMVAIPSAGSVEDWHKFPDITLKYSLKLLEKIVTSIFHIFQEDCWGLYWLQFQLSIFNNAY